MNHAVRGFFMFKKLKFSAVAVLQKEIYLYICTPIRETGCSVPDNYRNGIAPN